MCPSAAAATTSGVGWASSLGGTARRFTSRPDVWIRALKATTSGRHHIFSTDDLLGLSFALCGTERSIFSFPTDNISVEIMARSSPIDRREKKIAICRSNVLGSGD